MTCSNLRIWKLIISPKLYRIPQLHAGMLKRFDNSRGLLIRLGLVEAQGGQKRMIRHLEIAFVNRQL